MTDVGARSSTLRSISRGGAVVLLGLTLLLAGCATSLALEPGEAYLLSRIGYSQGFPLGGLEFRNVDTGEDLLVRPGRAVLTRAAPGRYYMRRVRSVYDNVMGGELEKPEAFIQVEAGKINYIGSWAIVVTKETDSKIQFQPSHDYPADVVREAKQGRRAEVFSMYSLVEARPRFEIGPADAGAEQAD